MEPQRIVVSGKLLGFTPAALRIGFSEEVECWIPRSVIDFESPMTGLLPEIEKEDVGQTWDFDIAYWFAKKNDLEDFES